MIELCGVLVNMEDQAKIRYCYPFEDNSFNGSAVFVDRFQLLSLRG